MFPEIKTATSGRFSQTTVSESMIKLGYEVKPDHGLCYGLTYVNMVMTLNGLSNLFDSLIALTNNPDFVRMMKNENPITDRGFQNICIDTLQKALDLSSPEEKQLFGKLLVDEKAIEKHRIEIAKLVRTYFRAICDMALLISSPDDCPDFFPTGTNLKQSHLPAEKLLFSGLGEIKEVGNVASVYTESEITIFLDSLSEAISRSGSTDYISLFIFKTLSPHACHLTYHHQKRLFKYTDSENFPSQYLFSGQLAKMLHDEQNAMLHTCPLFFVVFLADKANKGFRESLTTLFNSQQARGHLGKAVEEAEADFRHTNLGGIMFAANVVAIREEGKRIVSDYCVDVPSKLNELMKLNGLKPYLFDRMIYAYEFAVYEFHRTFGSQKALFGFSEPRELPKKIFSDAKHCEQMLKKISGEVINGLLQRRIDAIQQKLIWIKYDLRSASDDELKYWIGALSRVITSVEILVLPSLQGEELKYSKIMLSLMLLHQWVSSVIDVAKYKLLGKGEALQQVNRLLARADCKQFINLGTNKVGDTVLDLAFLSGYGDSAAALIRAGAISRETSETGLHLAVHTLLPECVREILSDPAIKKNINSTNESGMTPLDLAFKCKQADIAIELISNGATISQGNKSNDVVMVMIIRRITACFNEVDKVPGPILQLLFQFHGFVEEKRGQEQKKDSFQDSVCFELAKKLKGDLSPENFFKQFKAFFASDYYQRVVLKTFSKIETEIARYETEAKVEAQSGDTEKLARFKANRLSSSLRDIKDTLPTSIIDFYDNSTITDRVQRKLVESVKALASHKEICRYRSLAGASVKYSSGFVLSFTGAVFFPSFRRYFFGTRLEKELSDLADSIENEKHTTEQSVTTTGSIKQSSRV